MLSSASGTALIAGRLKWENDDDDAATWTDDAAASSIWVDDAAASGSWTDD